jgi:hypothetical protein
MPHMAQGQQVSRRKQARQSTALQENTTSTIVLAIATFLVTDEAKRRIPWISEGWIDLIALALFIIGVFLLKPKLIEMFRRLIPKDRYELLRLVNVAALAIFLMVGISSLFNLSIVKRLVIANSTVGGSIKSDRTLPRVTAVELKSRKTFEGVAVYLSDISNEVRILDNKTFVNCDFIGPGIMVPMNGTILQNSVFAKPSDIPSRDAFFEAMFWLIQPSKPLLGALPVNGAIFNDSHFYDVGFAGDETFRQRLLQSLSVKTQ